MYMEHRVFISWTQINNKLLSWSCFHKNALRVKGFGFEEGSSLVELNFKSCFLEELNFLWLSRTQASQLKAGGGEKKKANYKNILRQLNELIDNMNFFSVVRERESLRCGWVGRQRWCEPSHEFLMYFK